jgi:hypothetical protein
VGQQMDRRAGMVSLKAQDRGGKATALRAGMGVADLVGDDPVSAVRPLESDDIDRNFAGSRGRANIFGCILEIAGAIGGENHPSFRNRSVIWKKLGSMPGATRCP